MLCLNSDLNLWLFLGKVATMRCSLPICNLITIYLSLIVNCLPVSSYSSLSQVIESPHWSYRTNSHFTLTANLFSQANLHSIFWILSVVTLHIHSLYLVLMKPSAMMILSLILIKVKLGVCWYFRLLHLFSSIWFCLLLITITVYLHKTFIPVFASRSAWSFRIQLYLFFCLTHTISHFFL